MSADLIIDPDDFEYAVDANGALFQRIGHMYDDGSILDLGYVRIKRGERQ